MMKNLLGRTCALSLAAIAAFACGSSGTVAEGTFAAEDGGPPGNGTNGPGTFGTGTELEGGAGDGGTCAAVSKRAQINQLDLLLLVDSSASMLANEKWKSVTNAIQTFMADPRLEGVGIGLQYFPRFAGALTVCDENEYAVPEIEILPLDTTQQGIVGGSLEVRTPLGGTPMGPAIQGALRFATTWQQRNTNRKVALVLATDGLPDESCQFAPEPRAPNSITAVQQQAASAPIPTYVIGVGTELTALNSVAAAGGTGQAIIVDPSGDTAAQLVSALDKVRRDQLGCEYGIPAPDPGQELDFGRVNVRFVDELGYVDFFYVPSPADCAGAENGWYYDNPARPTKILLCEPFCTEVRASRLGRVDVLLGCKRNEAVIR